MLFSKKFSVMVILFMILSFMMSTYAFAWSYAGYCWPTNNALYKYGNNLPSSYQTPVYTAAGTWNSDPADFSLYNDSSANNVWGAANYGSASGMLGITSISKSGTTVTGANSDYNTYYSWSTNPGPNEFDLESVALHEFGHWLVLKDIVHPSSAVMYHSLNPGQKKRSLTTDDSNGINYIY